MTRREAYFGALAYEFKSLMIEAMPRNGSPVGKITTRQCWKIAKYKAASYVFRLKSRTLDTMYVDIM